MQALVENFTTFRVAAQFMRGRFDMINTAIRDHKDGEVGKVGYEINFNRYFYQYTPPRPLEEIEADIREIEKDIVQMLAEVTGSNKEELVP